MFLVREKAMIFPKKQQKKRKKNNPKRLAISMRHPVPMLVGKQCIGCMQIRSFQFTLKLKIRQVDPRVMTAALGFDSMGEAEAK